MHCGGRRLRALPLLAGWLAVALGAVAQEASRGPMSAPGGAARLGLGPPEPGSYTLPALGEAADGAVLDAEGGRRQLHALYAGRIALLSFIYTRCKDGSGCPLALAVMHQVKSALEADPELSRRTALLSLSFDPERDTPGAMRAYGAAFRGGSVDWEFLTTGSAEELAPILADYGQWIQPEMDADGKPSGDLSHLLRVFLIDSDKRIRNVYSSSFLDAALVLSDVRTLVLEEGGAGSQPAALRSSGSAASAQRVLDLLLLAERPPLGLPPLPVPEKDPITDRKVDLGRKLFFDRRLSLNDTISCAMCHIPEQGFTNRELATAVGIEGRTVRRNSPTLYNVGYARRLFHDGREGKLEQQVWVPLLAANEMGNPSVGAVLEKIETLSDYAGLFEAAFGGAGPGMETLGRALASYQRTLLSANSPFDRWRFGGEADALSESAQRGFRLFTETAGCAACHSIDRDYALFTDHQMHNTGIGYRRSMQPALAATRVEIAPGSYVEMAADTLAAVSEAPPADLGLYEITQDPRDRWKYKTPSLRNATLTAPYMHDGSLRTLREVVEFYDAGGVPNETLDPRIRPLGLSPGEVDDLIAFLESLTGDNAELLALESRRALVGNPDAAVEPRTGALPAAYPSTRQP